MYILILQFFIKLKFNLKIKLYCSTIMLFFNIIFINIKYFYLKLICSQCWCNFNLFLTIYDFSKTIAQPRAGFDKLLEVTKVQEDPIRTAFDKIESKDCEDEEKPRQGKRCAETLLEQENSNLKQEGPKKAKSKKTEPKQKSTSENILDSPKSTKSLKQQKDKKVDKSCRRRLLPQVKGQSKLTGFFRMWIQYFKKCLQVYKTYTVKP